MHAVGHSLALVDAKRAEGIGIHEGANGLQTVAVAGDEIENLLDVSKQIIAAVGLEAQVLEFIQNGLLCLLVAHQNNLVGVGL